MSDQITLAPQLSEAVIKGLEPRPQDSPAKIQDAAQQFEALLLSQILKEMRESNSGGWMGTGEQDNASEQAMGMAHDFFAQSLAKQGGMGISKMVLQGLEKH